MFLKVIFKKNKTTGERQRSYRLCESYRFESGMNSRFSQRFEQGLSQIKESLDKKGGVKRQEKVWERIGRLKTKYPSIHKYYDIETHADDDNKGIITGMTW